MPDKADEGSGCGYTVETLLTIDFLFFIPDIFGTHCYNFHPEGEKKEPQITTSSPRCKVLL